jgi:hypothetical protein
MDLKAISEATEDERKQGLVEWAQAFTARDWEQIRQIELSGSPSHTQKSYLFTVPKKNRRQGDVSPSAAN